MPWKTEIRRFWLFGSFFLQTIQDVVENLKIPSKWASRNCQDGLYIPLIFSALGFNLNTKNIFAGKNIDDQKIGKFRLVWGKFRSLVVVRAVSLKGPSSPFAAFILS